MLLLCLLLGPLGGAAHGKVGDGVNVYGRNSMTFHFLFSEFSSSLLQLYVHCRVAIEEGHWFADLR